jgi:hypothetical protein
MCRRRGSGGLTVQAIADARAVFLAFDLAPDVRPDCMVSRKS